MLVANTVVAGDHVAVCMTHQLSNTSCATNQLY